MERMPATEPRAERLDAREAEDRRASPRARQLNDYDIRPYRPGDERAILATFERVFVEGRSGKLRRSLADWQWIYADNPVGMRVWLAMDGPIVAAHYASQPRRMLVEGREAIFVEIIDSMAHPEHRSTLQQPGLFVELADRMLTATCGAGKDLVAYGWPNHQALKLGRRKLGYEVVREDQGLSRAPGPGPSTLPDGTEEVRAFDGRIRHLYERCASEWGASTIRDASYLEWRILRRPRNPYRVVATLAPDGEYAGFAVFRLMDWPTARSGVLCDWLVPSSDVGAGERLLEAVLTLGRAARADSILALFPPWSPWFERFRARGFHAGDTGYAMVSGRYNDPRYPPAWLRERWWYQPLDLDLF